MGHESGFGPRLSGRCRGMHTFSLTRKKVMPYVLSERHSWMYRYLAFSSVRPFSLRCSCKIRFSTPLTLACSAGRYLPRSSVVCVCGLWSPSCTWHCIAANCTASSREHGCVALRMSSRAYMHSHKVSKSLACEGGHAGGIHTWTYIRLSWTGSLRSTF